MILTRTPGTTKDTISWQAVPGAVAYKFTVDGKISHTWDPTRTTLTVSTGAERILVEALASKDSGVLPATTTPPPENAYWHEAFEGPPSPGWFYEYNGQTTQNFQGPAFTIQPNGSGGGCLRIGTPPNAPGGAGILGAMYAGGGSPRARGQQGNEYWIKFRFRFNEHTLGWIFEQHEHYGGPPDIYSNGIMVGPGRKLIIQRTGGPASNHPGSEGWRSYDQQVLEPMKWYDILHQVRWSGGNDGFYRVWLDGRQLTINKGENAGTLITSGSFTDQVGLGFYSYPYGQPSGPMFTEFDYATQGPTRSSVGG